VPTNDERSPRPAHHAPGGGFRNSWPSGARAGVGGLLRWMLLERLLGRRAATPRTAAWTAPRATPSFDVPRAPTDALTATWIGHATFLLQIGGWNVLTDPMWSERASPVAFAGPRRLAPPGVALDALPPIDAVLLTHDHYDHLDYATVRRVATRWPAARWAAPLGVAQQLAARGARDVVELDWWETTRIGPLALACVPAQHFSGRGMRDRDRALWCGWALRAPDAGGAARDGVLFAGDTGLHPEFDAIARRHGPFALALLPIGAYAPRWFMRPVHCDPDDATAAYGALVGASPSARAPVCGAMHWGTFRLTDEPLDEPPQRMRAAWQRAGHAAERLWIAAIGETLRVVD
jgi:N-acyl-phosphatidylethanolamine-hydrolysing phospholipase D